MADTVREACSVAFPYILTVPWTGPAPNQSISYILNAELGLDTCIRACLCVCNMYYARGKSVMNSGSFVTAPHTYTWVARESEPGSSSSSSEQPATLLRGTKRKHDYSITCLESGNYYSTSYHCYASTTRMTIDLYVYVFVSTRSMGEKRKGKRRSGSVVRS